MKNPFSKTKIDEYADKDVQELVKRVIRDDLSGVVAEVIEAQLKPINALVGQMQATQDILVKQVNEDRKEISSILTKQTIIDRQQQTIISNQNHSEDRNAAIVKEEAKKIPAITKRAVENMFEHKPFLTKIREKFIRKEAKK